MIYIFLDPLSLDDACMVAKKMLELSDKTLYVVCQCLGVPEIIFLKEKSKWRLCMTILIVWEDLSSENDASKKTLAIKLMKAANEIHKQSEGESKKLEIIARSLDYKGKINNLYLFNSYISWTFLLIHGCHQSTYRY